MAQVDKQNRQSSTVNGHAVDLDSKHPESSVERAAYDEEVKKPFGQGQMMQEGHDAASLPHPAISESPQFHSQDPKVNADVELNSDAKEHIHAARPSPSPAPGNVPTPIPR